MIDFDEINSELKKLTFRHSIENFIPPENNIIYHYTNIESLKSIIVEGTLRASNSMFLNDKSEVIHLQKFINEISIEVANSLSDTDRVSFTNYIQGLFNRTIEDLSRKIFILSFSSKYDSLPLWNYYGKNDGYCLGFDFDKLIKKFKIDNIQKLIKPSLSISDKISISVDLDFVIYEDGLKIDTLKKYIELLFKIENNLSDSENKITELIDSSKKIYVLILLMAYFSKEVCFSDEHEFRVIFLINNYLKDIIKFRISNGLIIPYIDILLKDIESDLLPLKEIIIGPKINIDIAKEGIDYFIKQIGYSDIQIKNSNIPLRY